MMHGPQGASCTLSNDAEPVAPRRAVGTLIGKSDIKRSALEAWRKLDEVIQTELASVQNGEKELNASTATAIIKYIEASMSLATGSEDVSEKDRTDRSRAMFAKMHTGLDAEATVELGTDILTGELKQDDPIWTGLQQRGVSRDAAHGAVSQVVQVGQQAPLRELGESGYNELSRLADNSPAIKAVVIKHGVARMQGRTKNATWKHVLTLARQFARA